MNIYQYVESSLFDEGHAKIYSNALSGNELRHQDFLDFIEHIGRDLIAAGLKPGDHVLIMAPYTWRWMAVELAILRCGGVVVGVDLRESQDYFDHVRMVTSARYVVTDDRLSVQHLKGIGQLKLIEWDMLRLGDRVAEWPSVCDHDRATIIFTSGTTGQPKGIPYTHGQMIYALEAIVSTFSHISINKERVISWLPLNHLFQRIINLVCIKECASLYFLSDHKQLLQAMNVVRPTIFLGVPQFYEYSADQIVNHINETKGILGRVLRYFWKASFRIQAGDSYVGDFVALFLAKLTLFRKIKSLFGGRIKVLISGSAPIRRNTLDMFELIGLPILEAYGVSENVVPIAMNNVGDYKKGSVGKPLAVNEVVIGSNDEVLVKGQGVLSGYISSDCESVVDDQGFLHTGDIGYLDDEGFLFIQGRRADFLKLSNGKKVFPKHIESILEESASIEQAFVTTNDNGRLVALVHIASNSWETLEDDYLNELKCVCNDQLKKYERLERIVPLNDRLSVEDGELTATQKYRRFVIKNKYHELINGVGVTS